MGYVPLNTGGVRIDPVLACCDRRIDVRNVGCIIILNVMTASNFGDYGSWDLSALKEELKKRGARVSGRKAELIERYIFANSFLIQKV